MSATDCGKSNTHQAGMLIPKRNTELLRFMPSLNLSEQNPDAIFRCIDAAGERWEFRYIYYTKKQESIATPFDIVPNVPSIIVDWQPTEELVVKIGEPKFFLTLNLNLVVFGLSVISLACEIVRKGNANVGFKLALQTPFYS